MLKRLLHVAENLSDMWKLKGSMSSLSDTLVHNISHI